MGTGLAPLIVVPIALQLDWWCSFLVLSTMSLAVGLSMVFLIKGEVSKSQRVRLSLPGNVYLLSVANFIALSAFFGFLTFLVSFLVHSGTSLKRASSFFSLLSVVGIAGSLFGGRLYDTLGRRSIGIVFGANALLTLTA